ncbi:MAG TPA: hypothetical protein VIH18_18570 [Candidatus Binatia bacterium]
MTTKTKVATGVVSPFLIVLCLLAGSAYADTLNRHVRVHNNSSYVMTELRASNVRRTDWEEDILGVRTLPPGRSINVNIDDGSGHCRYDLKARFGSGAEVVRWNVDVCTVTDWRIFNNSNRID